MMFEKAGKAVGARTQRPLGERHLLIVKTATAIAVISAVTWLLVTFGPEHPVFYYLLPIALVMVICGSMPALPGLVGAIACADYFLYEPLYSFAISTRVEFGDLACFALVAFMGV